MVKYTRHFFYRILELGPFGIIRHVSMRVMNSLALWGQSVWWGWMARRKISETSFLACMTGEWPSIATLLNHLDSRPTSSFLFPHDSSQESATLLKHQYPEYVAAVLASADAVCRGELSLLGQVFQYPTGIDWQCDPVTGWRWPLYFRGRMSAYIGSARPVDLIFFWELNRHQHFISLGIAYWLTDDERYVNTFIDQILSWIKTNPLRHGLNWYYPLEVSIRLLAWTSAFQFFRKSPEFQQRAGKAFIQSLWQQTDFLRGHLQMVRVKEDTPNNHMMAELAGLILVATAFPEFRAAAEWRETGLRLLIEQAGEQIYPDGVHKEQAAGYHRFVSELLILVLARGYQRVEKEQILQKTLEQMLDYVQFSITPSGTNPMWGDSDYGRALGLGQNKDFWDFRPLLSTGAVLFNRSDWKLTAGRFDEEAFWLLGIDGLNRWNLIETYEPEPISRAFPQGGDFIIRDSWTADTDVAFFRCGEFGLGGEGHCAHAHCDLLSFVLWMKGHQVLVDAGTYMYHGPLRDYFRLAPAHNTVLVDGHDQAVPKPNFNWQQISNAKCVDWSGHHVTGVINYQGVEFTRKLDHPCPGIWTLDDRFFGDGEHKFEWFFNFAPNLEVELFEKDGLLKVSREGLPFLNVNLPKNGVNVVVTNAWCSYQYGVKQSIKRLCARWHGSLEERGEIFLWKFDLVNADPVSSKDQFVVVAGK